MQSGRRVKREQYTFKCKVVNYAEEHESTKRLIRGWMKRKDLILELASSNKWKHARLIRRLGTSQVLATEVEESIVKWIMDLRSEGIPFTYLMVTTRALEEASDLNELSRLFKAARPWLKRLFARHRL
ncbi:hypothetical protein Ae201684P_010257 [Aphanomyces euteiches]|nr:hypothetical protein Ae201684P_010257 [Aphanomyces euteiches]